VRDEESLARMAARHASADWDRNRGWRGIHALWKASMRWSLWYSDRWPDVSGLAFAAAGRNVPVRVFNISAISFPATPCRHPFTHAERATRNNRRQNGFDRVLGAPTWPMSTQFSIS